MSGSNGPSAGLPKEILQLTLVKGGVNKWQSLAAKLQGKFSGTNVVLRAQLTSDMECKRILQPSM